MKKLLLIFLLLPFVTKATDFYVSNAGNNSNNGTSTGTSWQTLSKVETAAKNGTIQPGDFIRFKRGDVFLAPDKFNGMQWWAWGGNTAVSGTEANPITLTSYGTGAPPNFMFPNPASTDSVSRSVMSFEGVSWIIIDGLNFIDGLNTGGVDRRQPNYKLRAAWTTAAVILGETGSGAESYNCVVRNCVMFKIGNGVVMCGDNNIVENCTMDDFGNVYAIGTGSYGANAITITGENNIIQDNAISGAWAYSSAFGANGGAVEMFGTCKNNQILRNKFVDCGGITEYGATGSGHTCDSNMVAYNAIINCGNIAYGNFGASFAVTPNNNKYYNNLYIENSYSRFSGANFGIGFETFPSWPTLPEPETLVFANAGSPSATTVWNVKNNIFINENNMDVYQSSSSKFSHTNNVYKLSGGSAPGYTIGGTEVSTSTKLLIGEGSTDPATWDYHLSTGSPAIAIGAVIAGLNKDYYGFVLSGVINAGVSNSVGTPPPSGNTIKFPVKINGVYYKGWKN